MANRMAGLLFGRTPEEMIGRRMHPLVHHHNADGSVHPRSQCAIQCALDTGTASRVIDEVFWRKDGTSFPVEYVSSPLMDEGVRRGAVVIFSDVTESRKLQRRLEQASRVSSLGRMAATIAHEFNNVLMGIQPFAEVARRRAGDDVKLQQAASHILNSVARGRNITQDILRVTRPPDPVPQSIDVTEWLEDLAAEIRAVIGERFPVHVRSAAPGTLFARFDPSQMQQVITNLALNARDAMAGGGTLRLSASSNDTTVRLAIGDDGCGIPPETLPFIFEPLFTTKRSGTGLGLAVAQQVVIGNGGTITVESSEAGTTFSIDLPAVPPGVRAAPLELRAPPKNVALRRVVIVEDDLAVARGLTVVLEAEGIAVHVVHLGQEAVPAVEAFRPDAVVIDVGLPDVSGATVYKQLVARWPDMGVIFSTGHAEESVMPQASSRRVGFLRKPYSADTLLSKLREVV
jgi:PAS domain S-box-containing protein